MEGSKKDSGSDGSRTAQLEGLAEAVLELNARAMDRIMEVYGRAGDDAGSLAVETKADDSPVTLADRVSDEVLSEGLGALTPDVPVVSEERPPPEGLSRGAGAAPPGAPGSLAAAGAFWLVDPLDGTREFIDRNGEFTTNVALVVDGRPLLGIVGLPVTGEVFLGIDGVGAFRVARERETWRRVDIGVRPVGRTVRVLASRRVGGEATARFLARLEDRFEAVTLIQAGSALKLCRVAEGAADVYARPGPTCWWDTAAAQAVVEAAGGQVWRWGTREPVRYRPGPGPFDPLNPHFLVVADPAVDWVGFMADPEGSTTP